MDLNEQAEKWSANGLKTLRKLEQPNTVLEKLGPTRVVFKSMLEIGGLISEAHPAARLAFAICTMAWERLEKQEKLNGDIKDLTQRLVDVAGLLEVIRDHARTEHLKNTLQSLCDLIEDVSIFALDFDPNTSFMHTARSLFDSTPQDEADELVRRFQRLQKSLSMSMSAQVTKVIVGANDRELLRQLRPVEPSGHDPTRICQEGTRVALLNQLRKDIESQSPNFLWISGQAGMGKSAVATSLCEVLSKPDSSGSPALVSFFCRRDDPNMRDPLQLVNSVIYGLCGRCPSYGREVATVIEENTEICTSYLRARWEKLVQRPLEQLKIKGSLGQVVVVIDALDECGTIETRRQILECVRTMTSLASWISVVVTSRPNDDICDFFDECPVSTFIRRDIHVYSAAGDIREFVQAQLQGVDFEVGQPHDHIGWICDQAGELFIWAATACSFVRNTYDHDGSMEQLKSSHSGLSDLDALYTTVITGGTIKQQGNDKIHVRHCIGAVLAASKRTPLSLDALGQLMQGVVKPKVLKRVVKSLGAVLYVDEGLGGAIRFYHPSFADYVLDKDRAGDLWIDPRTINSYLLSGCTLAMKQELRFNICGLETSHLLNTQVVDLQSRVKGNISEHLRYSAVYWISHWIESANRGNITDVAALMAGPKLLYWLEVLSLTGNVNTALRGLPLLAYGLTGDNIDLQELVKDAYRFVSTFVNVISASSPHIYVSALAFAPTESKILQNIGPLFPNRIKVNRGGDAHWPRWLRTLQHPDEILSMSVSGDGLMLASACSDDQIRFWDLITGEQIGDPLTLILLQSLSLSPNGAYLAAGGLDEIRIWDVKQRKPVGNPLVVNACARAVNSVTFSPDSLTLASGYSDHTIQFWDIATLNMIGNPIAGHAGPVTCLAFSPDGFHLASGSEDKTIRIWDVKTFELVDKPFEGHTDEVTCLAYSPDGSLMTSGTRFEPNILVWRVMGGEVLLQLQAYSGVDSIAFSSDGTLILSAFATGEIAIWDAKSGNLDRNPLKGHLGSVACIAFLPNSASIVSGSSDGTIRLWDLTGDDSGYFNKQLFGHYSRVNSIGFSSDGATLVSGGSDSSVWLWDVKTGSPIDGLYADDPVGYVSFLPGDEKLVVACEKIIKIREIKAIEPTNDTVTLPIAPSAYSYEAHRAVSLENNELQLWDTNTGQAVRGPLAIISDECFAIDFSHDGSLLAVGLDDKTVKIWDVKTGQPVGDVMEGHSELVSYLIFSPDGTHLATGSYDKTIRIWDVATQALVAGPLEGHKKSIQSLTFSPDSTFLVSGDWRNVINLWDVKTGRLVSSPLIGDSKNILSLAVSSDGNYLASGTRDGTINIWDISAKNTQGPAEKYRMGEPRFDLPINTSYPPPHPTQTGWVSHDGQSILFWLPVQYRRIHDPRLLHSISVDPLLASVHLDGANFVHGVNWTRIACEDVRDGKI
ncbi:unnamed protein product [Rhizoctonia solani]|uniref:NACHT domain-containing protein n=1 Tax=Rhizoctonia solani TaxID=456999 RepID=A0A8H2WBY7_9AGAM|nr:unnamed protein product [Rhizoctonia solani]